MIHPGRVVRSKPFFEPSDFRLDADTWGSIFGGDKSSTSEDVFATANLSLKQVLIGVQQLVIIEISMIAAYHIENGTVSLIFAKDHPFVACPRYD